MHLYDGKVVYQSQSDEGRIEVIDADDGLRALHFGSLPRQSAMRLNSPNGLELTYTHSMMGGSLLLNPQPQKVLVIGLGGGTLVKFLLHQFSDCQVDVVEYRRDVIEVAHKYFDLPENEPRLNINYGDGYEYVSRCLYTDSANYDLILVDAYDHHGMADSISGQPFFDACVGILTAKGVMAINLWGTNRPLFTQVMQYINNSFESKTLLLPVENKGNIIGFGTKHLVKKSDFKRLKPYLEIWEMQYQIKLTTLLNNMSRQHRQFITRLFV